MIVIYIFSFLLHDSRISDSRISDSDISERERTLILVLAFPGKMQGAENAAAAKDAGSGNAGGKAAARRWPRRGPGLSWSLHPEDTDEDALNETTGGAKNEVGDDAMSESRENPDEGQCDRECSHISGDASNDDEESQSNSNAFHGHSRVEVVVEPPTVWHTIWEAWLPYFATYCKRTMQVLPVRETMS